MAVLREHPGLPKWPGVVVTGKSVTVEQAKEIIFRTDKAVSFPSEYFGGNDRRFRQALIKDFGWNLFAEDDWEAKARWSHDMCMLETNYVYNRWLSTSYIGGPTGWCSPEGIIDFRGHNYGKWPSISDVMADWRVLSGAFPYLDLACTLFSDEAGSEGSEPVCTIIVKDKQVEAHTPDLSLHKLSYDRAVRERDPDIIERMIAGMNVQDYSYERAWPESWIQEFAVKSRTVVARILLTI